MQRTNTPRDQNKPNDTPNSELVHPHLTRRRTLQWAGAMAALGIVGCVNNDDSDDDEQTPPDTRTFSFSHGVASGDPLSDRVILWTRCVPSEASDVTVTWSIHAGSDESNTFAIASGRATTNADRDYIVKVDVIGLSPGSDYTYRFTVGGTNFTSGITTSPVGHTRTLATGSLSQAKFAVFSCSNYPKGYFHAYRHAATRSDIDAVLHLGDYIYEYGPDGYPSMNAIPERAHLPSAGNFRAR